MSDDDYKRMCWASRRGMLELDLILEPFVKEHYRGMSDEDKGRYRSLMESQDQELFGWFLKRELPEDAELATMVKRILDSRTG